MKHRRGEGPEPPPRPRWEWWTLPAPGCWLVVVVAVAAAVAAHLGSLWGWVALGILGLLFLGLRGAVRNDCGT